MAAENLNIWC